MALLSKHRATIHERLSPVIGEEETEALLAQFPSHDDEEPITKHYLRAEMSTLAGELRAEMKDMRTELKGDIAELRTELKDDVAGLRTELKGDTADVRIEMRDMGTALKDELSKVRMEMTDLRGHITDMMRRQTVWVTSAFFGFTVVVSTVVSATG